MVEVERLALAHLVVDAGERPGGEGDADNRKQGAQLEQRPQGGMDAIRPAPQWLPGTRRWSGAFRLRVGDAHERYPRRVTLRARRSRCASTSARSMPSAASRASVK